MSIEKLTDEERDHICALYGTDEAEFKALRIIDQLTEALAAAEADLRVERQEREKWWNRGTAAEARVRELEADVSAAHQAHANDVNAKQQRLAAANALLQAIWDNGDLPQWLGRRIKAHLSGAAITAVTLTPAERAALNTGAARLPAAPYAVLADGTSVPLMNCPECRELGRADMAHYHSCPDVKTDSRCVDREEDQPAAPTDHERAQCGVRVVRLSRSQRDGLNVGSARLPPPSNGSTSERVLSACSSLWRSQLEDWAESGTASLRDLANAELARREANR